jgi:hypothetical protein
MRISGIGDGLSKGNISFTQRFLRISNKKEELTVYETYKKDITINVVFYIAWTYGLPKKRS